MSQSCYTCLPVFRYVLWWEKEMNSYFYFSVTCNWKYGIPNWWSTFINNSSFELHGKPVRDFHYSYFTNIERELYGVSLKSTHLEKDGPGPESWKSQTLCAFSTILMSISEIRCWTHMGKEDEPLRVIWPMYWVTSGSSLPHHLPKY